MSELTRAPRPTRSTLIRNKVRESSVFPFAVGFRRLGRSVRGSVFDEVTYAIWLCADDYFADIRFAYSNSASNESLDVEQAFSGRVSLDRDHITWYHDIDTLERGNLYQDEAQFCWKDDLLIEVGEDYVEHWKSFPMLSPQSYGVAQLFDSGSHGQNNQGAKLIGRAVVVGASAIVLWAYPVPGAVLFEAVPDWRMVKSIGQEVIRPDAVKVLNGISNDHTLPDGWERVV